MTITAKVIAHSLPNWAGTEANHDIFTLELTYPRFIHAEFMTHRMFSRNASSSRAIPAIKMMQAVASNPAEPVYWGANQTGMQAYEELDDDAKAQARSTWFDALRSSASHAGMLGALGVHKQILNRILEPWAHITVVVTATEWDNFFKLRDHPAAQPEIQALARAMQDAMGHSTYPKELHNGDWHTPYALPDLGQKDSVKTSVAGCARVSYNNHDGSDRDVLNDIALYNRLKDMGHMSPFEHQATPMTEHTVYSRHTIGNLKGVTLAGKRNTFWSGNFKNWIQYRQTLV